MFGRVCHWGCWVKTIGINVNWHDAHMIKIIDVYTPAEMVLAMRTDPKVKCEEDEGEGMSV